MYSYRRFKKSTSAMLLASALLLVPWPGLACGHQCCSIACASEEAPCDTVRIVDMCGPPRGGCTHEDAVALVDVRPIIDARRLVDLTPGSLDHFLGRPAIRFEAPHVSGSGGALAEAPSPFPGGRAPSTLGPRPPPRISRLCPYAFSLSTSSTRPVAPREFGRFTRMHAASTGRD